MPLSKTERFLRELGFRTWYEELAQATERRIEWTFMNYGLLDENTEQIVLAPEDEPNRYAIALYHLLFSRVDLRDKRLLEVGCGRGGGAAYAARYFGPQSVTALDRTERIVRFCEEAHRVDGLAFVCGHAEALPFDEGSFDVVSNVEVSHCFGSFDRFLDNVMRVLVDDGSFLFADFRPTTAVDALEREIDRAGFTRCWMEDITDAVLAAMTEERRQKSIHDLCADTLPESMRASFERFAGATRSPIADAMRKGETRYVAYHLCKTANRS